MDLNRLDHLARMLASESTRRRLLGILPAAPMLGGLVTLLDLDDAEAKKRRRRRKDRHRKRQDKAAGKRRRRQHRRACKPKSKAKVCAGQCGLVKSRKTCGKTVDCGSCACNPPCGECLVCQAGPSTPGTCMPDPAQVGDACGSDGQVCQADGTCACAASSCANPTPICDQGTCVACSESRPCPAGCCDATGSCQPGDTTTACGAVGEVCTTCASGEVCDGDACICPSQVSCPASGCCASAEAVCDLNDECCVPMTCADQGAQCGIISDGCGGTVDCGSCACHPPCAPCMTCQETSGKVGVCVPLADGTACDASDPCLTGSTCTGGVCGGGSTICTTPPECYVAVGATCVDGTCTYQPAAAGSSCGTSGCDVCDGAGTCVTVPVCDNGACCDPQTAVCYNGVCAVKCAAGCPAGSVNCLQVVIGGRGVNICVNDSIVRCGCDLNANLCPIGSTCLVGPLSGCDPENDCVEIVQPS